LSQGIGEMWVYKTLVGCIGLLALVEVTVAFNCKNHRGEEVDWYVAYKLPRLEDAKNSTVASGVAFLYADSSTGGSWVFSAKNVDDPDSAIGRTVRQIFDAKKRGDLFYATYNDEHPNGKEDPSRGHMKGALAFNDYKGFWLIHSVPRFPMTTTGTYEYPDTGRRFGQSFLCITFSSGELDQIGEQLLYSQPSVFDYHLPNSYRLLYPHLEKAITRKALPSGTKNYYSVQPINSLGGKKFMSFNKHKKFDKDLYADLVAGELKSSLYTETWLNGRPANDMTSSCKTEYKVYNSKSLSLYQFEFNNSKDHSKWAASLTAADGWICIGDINRQYSQEKRGGGTMCMADPTIWRLYQSAVVDYECCPTRSNSLSSYAWCQPASLSRALLPVRKGRRKGRGD
jgi:deoxyribonuclease-2